jgi:hypothetical protein
LPVARSIVVASPSPVRLSVMTRSLVGVRARYAQPYEDHVLGGGVLVLDAAIESVERTGQGYTVHTRSTDEGSQQRSFEVDDVIAATGFRAPLRDLPALGVATFGQSQLPAQTPYWESATVPGIYFAGTISQGAAGLRKHGLPSNSGAVQGARYNARVLARHLAGQHFRGEAFATATPRATLGSAELVPFIQEQLTHGPEIWHQRAYLAHVLEASADGGYVDAGIRPLVELLDRGPDGIAITLESDASGGLYPVLYRVRGGSVEERALEPHPLQSYLGERAATEVGAVLSDWGVPA